MNQIGGMAAGRPAKTLSILEARSDGSPVFSFMLLILLRKKMMEIVGLEGGEKEWVSIRPRKTPAFSANKSAGKKLQPFWG
jgi:hypothetical protein